MSGQLKKLEKEQTELLKTFDRHDADVKAQLAQNKTLTAERVYRCFFETYDQLEENRQQKRQLLKPKYLENFDADIERKLGERKNVLQWLVEKVPGLKEIEEYCSRVINCKDAIRLDKPEQKRMSTHIEMAKLTDLLKKYQQTVESGNQTSLVSSTSAGDKDPNETVIDTRNGVTENVEENVEISSRHSGTHRSKKEPSIANSRSSRRREIEVMELENMRAKKEADQRLRERQSQLEKKREEIELRRRQEELRLQLQHQQQQQQEEELRLQLQQQEDELRLRQHERELENERKNAEADEEQRVLKLELTKGSSRASGSEAGDLESVGSRRKPAISQDWL